VQLAVNCKMHKKVFIELLISLISAFAICMSNACEDYVSLIPGMCPAICSGIFLTLINFDA
jgi:hypothetical protein